MKLKKRRKLVKYVNILDRPISFNPFLFSRNFLLWALLGLFGGVIAGIYWIVLEFLTHQIAFFEGWQVIPAMAICGLLAGVIIHVIGDPGEIQLIVNNIRFNNSIRFHSSRRLSGCLQKCIWWHLVKEVQHQNNH